MAAVLASIYGILGKCDALDRVELREVSALDSGHNVAVLSLVSLSCMLLIALEHLHNCR